MNVCPLHVSFDDADPLLDHTPPATMGSRSLGELLLRPAVRIPLLPARTRAAPPSWTSHRTLTHSASTHSAQPVPKPQEEPAETPQQNPPSRLAAKPNPYIGLVSNPSAARRQSSSEQVSQGIDDLLASTNSPNFRRTMPTGTRAAGAAPSRPQRLFGADWSPSTGGMQRRKPLDLNEMAMPDDSLSALFDASPVRAPEIPESEKVYPRLTPSYGRKVELDPSRGRDLVRGIGMLTTLCARNKVKSDFNKQRYHERPGLKRKRLNSERWRAKFKVGFDQVTKRVTELTKKGW
jgi:small subunit ribosomal protein MRP21